MTGASAFVGELAVRSTLLIALAWLVAEALRGAGASAAMRHLAWTGAILGLLLLPAMMTALPALPLAVLPAEPTPAASVLAPEAEALAGGAPLVSASPSDASGALWLLSAYAAIAAFLLARLLAARWTLARLWREGDPADSGWGAMLARAAADLGLRRPVALRLARGFVMPMTWGTRAPRILLPAEARSWPEPQRRLVLLHELAHVRRRDSLALTAGGLACALYWLHPGAWFAARRLRLEQEIAADDLALRAGVPACHYADSLLDLAAAFHLPRTPIRGLSAPAMALTSQLEHRLAAIVGPGSRRAPGPVLAALGGGLALALTWVVATALPVRAEPIPAASASHPPAPQAAEAPTAAVVSTEIVAPPASATPVATIPTVPAANPSAPAAVPVAASLMEGGPAETLPDFEALEHENLALHDQAVRLSVQVAAREDAAVARGDTRLARHLNLQRRAYEHQARTYAHRNRVLAQQRRVYARRAEILARQAALIERRAEAARRGEPVPPFEPLPAIPPMPAAPPVPAIPDLPREVAQPPPA